MAFPPQLADLAQHSCILHRQNDDAFMTWKLSKGRKH
jgi:LysR family transcriptional activator of dmlA